MNMGTPMNPESVEHFTTKAMGWKYLDYFRKRQRPVPIEFLEVCGACNGGLFTENILDSVTAVRQEWELGGFRFDILLERGEAKPVALEIVHASRPSAQKLRYCAAMGIDLFEAPTRHPGAGPVRGHIATGNCRNPRRKNLQPLWESLFGPEVPLVGIVEDQRAPTTKRNEIDKSLDAWAMIEAEKKAGTLLCGVCNGSLVTEGGAVGTSLPGHNSKGDCEGEIRCCMSCHFVRQVQMGGGGLAVHPYDETCQACLLHRSKLKEESDRTMDRWEKRLKHRKFVERPLAGGGSVMVYEPIPPTQKYICGKSTWRKRDMVQVLLMLEMFLKEVEQFNVNAWRWAREEVKDILKQVAYANEIRDIDWLAAVGESHLDPSEDPGQGDNFIRPGLWFAAAPPPFIWAEKKPVG